MKNEKPMPTSDLPENAKAILRRATNPVFLLENMLVLFNPTTFRIHCSRMTVMHLLLNKYPMLRTAQTFDHLSAAILGDAFRLYNALFFGHAIGDVFEHHTRLLHLQVTNDQSALSHSTFGRTAIHHFIQINQASLLNHPFGPELFGVNDDLATPENRQRLMTNYEPILRGRIGQMLYGIEHALAHLITYTNWVNAAPHGPEYSAVSFAMFRHRPCSSNHDLNNKPHIMGLSRSAPVIDSVSLPERSVERAAVRLDERLLLTPRELATFRQFMLFAQQQQQTHTTHPAPASHRGPRVEEAPFEKEDKQQDKDTPGPK